jgi:superfamily II DNA helicase RecQ
MLEVVFQNKSSLLAVLGTGSGKSTSWLCPSVSEDGLSVVVLPLFALMHDVTNKLNALRNVLPEGKWLTWSVVKRNNMSADQVASMKLRLLLVSAEQALDSGFLEFVEKDRARKQIKRVIFDEPTLYLSSSFRRNLRVVPLLIRSRTTAPFILLSATVKPDEDEKALSAVFYSQLHVVRSCTIRPNVGIKVIYDITRENLTDVLAADLNIATSERAIIFVPRITDCAGISTALRRKNINACVSNSQLSERDQEKAISAWKDGTSPVIVATSGFLYGVDHPKVRHVVFVGGAYSMADFVQGLGRAGRDGVNSRCTVLLGSAAFNTGCGEEVVNYFQRRNRCRAMGLSEIFDVAALQLRTECGHCDFCTSARDRVAPRPRATRVADVVQESIVGRADQNTASSAIRTAKTDLLSVLEYVKTSDRAQKCFVCMAANRPVKSQHDLTKCPCFFKRCLKCFGNHSARDCSNYQDFSKAMKDASLCVTCCLPITVDGTATHPDKSIGASCMHKDRLLPAALYMRFQQLKQVKQTLTELTKDDLKWLTGVRTADGLLPNVVDVLLPLAQQVVQRRR